jgi:selenocysteine-specific elongation factor
MQIQPIVVGTAGHIDHGKSTLVRTLTGIDPDRLKEEQERGMTIDLGFARFELPDGRVVGVVDVPGHERFVKNMVAGASGLDLVVLVVAADDGVMPQTREHLAIMTILGIERGLVALTKIDMVEPVLVELAKEDVREAVRGTFLESAPILPLSAHTGEGMQEFKAALHAACAATKARPATGVFRMPIQRVFSAHGFGTVATGIPLSGALKIGDPVEILPAGLLGKARGFQAYGSKVDSIRAGHSSAINLADVDHARVARGMVAATPGFFRGMTMLGVRLKALASLERAIEDRVEVRVHAGTAEVLGEVVLLDCERLEPGAEGLAQLRLAEPIVVAPGDRMVVRLASPAWTLAGAVVLEESKHRLKRHKKFVLEELSRAEASLGSPRDHLEVVLARAQGGASAAEDLAVEVKRPRDEVERLLNDLKAQGKVARLGAVGRWIHAERLAQSLARVRSALEAHFAANTHRSLVDVRELRRATGLDAEFLDPLLAELARAGEIVVEAGGFVRKKGAAELDPAAAALKERVFHALSAARFQTPFVADLVRELGAPEKEILRVLQHACDAKEAVAIVKGEYYLPGALLLESREAIVANCGKHGSLDIPSLRDALSTTRKWLIPLLEHHDAAGLTIRQGANRVLKRR